MDLPGVLAVRDIVVNALRTDTPDGKPEPITPTDKWQLTVAPGKQPRLHESAWRLVFYKRNLPTPPHRDQVSAAWLEMKKQAQQRVETAHDEDVAIPQGRFRNVSRYHSFQNHFPAVFGLSDAGLPSTADHRRRAQALQLKAYLLFFDQVMANPPFMARGSATEAPNPAKAAAHVEGEADLGEWVRFALTMAKAKGTVTFIHRADRIDTLIAHLAGRAGEIVIFPLWAGAGKPASRVLVRARKQIAAPARIASGLVLHEADGRFTAAAEAVLRGGEGLAL